MFRLNKDKLHVEFRQNTTPTWPIIPRRYTLTHSDITAELFLTIATKFALEKINPMRDEVLGEWQVVNHQYRLFIYLHVDQGEYDEETAEMRFTIFNRELPLALESIRYGDHLFFKRYTQLEHAPIIVHFQSSYPQFNRIENFGTPSDYQLPTR